MIKHNRFRPLLAGIISAALVMTGCGGEKQARADIEKVVGSFFSSAFSLDLEGALACIDESSDYYTECSENGPLGLSADGMDPKAVLGEETGELLGDSADDFLQGIIDLTKRHSSYTVNEIELTDKNKASVTVTMSLPDFKEMDLSESMTVEDIGFDTSDFLAYVAEKGYSREDFLALDPDIGQEMVYEYMNSEGYLSDVLNTVLGKMDENISVTSTETRLTLRRAGGKWKITGEN